MITVRRFALCFMVFLLLFSLTVVAKKSDKDLTVYKELVLDLEISSSFEIVEQKPNAELKYAHADLLFYPYGTYRQHVKDVGANREYETIDDIYDKGFKFSWLGFERDYFFTVHSRLATENKVYPIISKVVFPILTVPADAKVYLKETEMMDYKTNGVQKLASRLAEGENDLYVVVFKIADWVKNNVEYDLNSVTADAALPASWVLENKYGVCDELTNLFIAMLRGVGVPARFVTGVAYTTSDLFDENWGAHGWAEVYFPGHGWVPFDVTYGQYGFLDATHLKLKHSVDSDKSSVEYEWAGRNIGVDLGDIDLSAEVVEHGEKKKNDDVTISANVYKQHVGLGSFNLLEVELENKMDYYNAMTLRLANSEKLKVYDKQEKGVLLKPGEKKRMYWIMKVSDDLDRDFVYTFTVKLDIVGRVTDKLDFTADRKGTEYTLQDVDEVLVSKKEGDDKVYSRNVDMKCSPSSELVYGGDFVDLSCVLQNIGNTLQEGLGICLGEECQALTLGIGEEQQIVFPYSIGDQLGDRQIELTTRNKDVLKSDFVTLRVLDKPVLVIEDIVHPSNVSMSGGNVTFGFTLVQKSTSIPLDVQVSVDYGKRVYTVVYDRVEGSTRVEFIIDPHDLLFERNQIPISVSYEDAFNTAFSLDEEVEIIVLAERLEHKMSQFFNSLLSFLDGLFAGM